MKKGQMTWYMIAILVMVMSASLLIFLFEDGLIRIPKSASEKLTQEQQVKQCENEVAECMLFRLGMTSGKMLFDEGPLPSFEVVEREGVRYLRTVPQACFRQMNLSGQHVEVYNLVPDILFNKQDVRITINNNIFLTKDESETKIADYTKKFPIEYQALYDTAIALRKRPKFPSVPETAIPLSDLPFDVEITKKDRARVISLIQTQPSPNIKDRYYRFNFLK